jgi:hypothetical protein
MPEVVEAIPGEEGAGTLGRLDEAEGRGAADEEVEEPDAATDAEALGRADEIEGPGAADGATAAGVCVGGRGSVGG